MRSAALQQINRRAGLVLGLGLTAVAAYNWRLWRRDRAFAAQLQAQRQTVPTLAAHSSVSVLVAAWNEGASIDEHIRSFLSLRYPDIELILCAGGADDTLRRARAYAGPQVRVLEQRAGEGKQMALARCLDHARGTIIYLTDADCRFSDEALSRVLAPIICEGEMAATGEIRPLDRQARKVLPAYLWMIDVVASARGPAYSRGLRGANTALHRDALTAIGGLSFSARTGTDYQLARRLLRAGIAIRYVPASLVPTAYPETIGVYRRKRSRWLRNLIIYGMSDGAYDDVIATARTVGVGALMTALPLSSALTGSISLASWAILITHTLGTRLRYLGFTGALYAWRPPIALLLWLLPLSIIDFAIWALPIIDLLTPQGRNRW